MEEGVAACRRSPMGFAHICLVLHREGSSFVRHRRTLFIIYGENPATKEGMSSLV